MLLAGCRRLFSDDAAPRRLAIFCHAAAVLLSILHLIFLFHFIATPALKRYAFAIVNIALMRRHDAAVFADMRLITAMFSPRRRCRQQ